MTTGLQLLSSRDNVLYLPFREGAGSTAYDQSGQGNNGTISGAVYKKLVDGGYALSFDGTSDKILVANETNFDFERTDSFTISIWFKINSIGINRFPLTKQVPSGNFTGFSIWQETTNIINFALTNTPFNQLELTTPAITDTTNWVHYCVSYDGSSNATGVKVYYNAIEQTKTILDNTLTASILNNVQVEIGNRNGAFNFNGQIAYPMIFSRALSLAEIQAIYRVTYIL